MVHTTAAVTGTAAGVWLSRAAGEGTSVEGLLLSRRDVSWFASCLELF
jgi:hypothetical protein